MPQIPTFDVPQQEQNLRIPEGGAQFLSQGARRLGAMGQEADTSITQGTRQLAAGVEAVGKTLEEHQTAAETAQILPRLALDQQQRMEQANGIGYGSQPAQVPAKLLQYKAEVLDPAKEQFLSGFTTTKAKETAEQAWGRHEAELYRHVGAIAAQAAGDTAHNALLGGINILIANVGKDPGLLDHNLDLADASINRAVNDPGTNPEARHMLTTSFAENAKAEMVANAIKTTAENNPAYARQMIAGGKYDKYIGQHVGTLNTYIDTQERLLQSRQKADDVQARQIETDTAKTAMTDAVSQTITPQGIKVGPDYFKRVQDILLMPGAARNPELVKAFVDYGQSALDRQSKGIKAVTDEPTKQELQGRLEKTFINPDDPEGLTYTRLYTAAGQGKLSDHDVSYFNGAIAHAEKPENADTNRIRAEGIAALKSIVNPKNQFGMPMIGDPTAAAYAESRALSWFNRTAQAGMQTGKYKTMQDAVDDLVTPEKLKQFAPTAGDSLPGTPAAGKKPSLDSIFGGFFGGKK